MDSTLNMAIAISAVDQFSSTFKNIGSAIQSFASGDMQSAASSAQAALGGIAMAAVAVTAKSVQMAADYQQSLLKIQAYAGMTKQQTDAMSQSLMDMAGAVGLGPKELADALYPLISSGYSASDALNMLKLSAETAAASGAKTSVVADGLSTVLKTFDIDASSAGNVMDILNKTVAQGKMEFPALASVIGKLSLSASGAKVPFTDMNAALDTLTTHGFPSVAQASNALGNLFTGIGVKTDAMAKHAKAAGISFDAQKFSTMNLADKIAYLNKITDGNQGKLLTMVGGSSVALKAFNALSGGAEDYSATLQKLQNAHGTTAQVFATAQQGFNQQMNQAKASIDAVMIKIGTALLPVLGQLAGAVPPIINTLQSWGNGINTLITWLNKHQDVMNILKAAFLVIAIQIASIVIPAFISFAITAIGAAIGVLIAWFPLIAAFALVTAVVYGIIEAVQHWGAIVAWLKGVWGAISSWFMSMLHAIGAFFVGVWNGIVSGLKAAWNAIVQVVKIGVLVLLAIIFAPIIAIAALFIWLYNHNTYFKMLVDAIVNFIKGCVAWLQNAWKTVVDWIVMQWNALVVRATDLWDQVSKAINDKFTAAVNFVKDIWNKISSFFVNAWNTYIAGPLTTLWHNVSNVFSSAWNTYVSKPLSDLWNSVSKWFTDLGTGAENSGKNFISMLVNGIKSGAGKIWDAVVGIAQNIWKALGFHSPAEEGPGADADKWMPNLVSMLSKDLIAGAPKIQAAVNVVAKPLAAIAQPAHAGVSSPIAAPAAAGGSGATVINNYYTVNAPALSRREADQLGQALSEYQSRKMRSSGNFVTQTSGGKR